MGICVQASTMCAQQGELFPQEPRESMLLNF